MLSSKSYTFNIHDEVKSYPFDNDIDLDLNNAINYQKHSHKIVESKKKSKTIDSLKNAQQFLNCSSYLNELNYSTNAIPRFIDVSEETAIDALTIEDNIYQPTILSDINSNMTNLKKTKSKKKSSNISKDNKLNYDLEDIEDVLNTDNFVESIEDVLNTDNFVESKNTQLPIKKFKKNAKSKICKNNLNNINNCNTENTKTFYNTDNNIIEEIDLHNIDNLINKDFHIKKRINLEKIDLEHSTKYDLSELTDLPVIKKTKKKKKRIKQICPEMQDLISAENIKNLKNVNTSINAQINEDENHNSLLYDLKNVILCNPVSNSKHQNENITLKNPKKLKSSHNILKTTDLTKTENILVYTMEEIDINDSDYFQNNHNFMDTKLMPNSLKIANNENLEIDTNTQIMNDIDQDIDQEKIPSNLDVNDLSYVSNDNKNEKVYRLKKNVHGKKSKSPVSQNLEEATKNLCINENLITDVNSNSINTILNSQNEYKISNKYKSRKKKSSITNLVEHKNNYDNDLQEQLNLDGCNNFETTYNLNSLNTYDNEPLKMIANKFSHITTVSDDMIAYNKFDDTENINSTCETNLTQKKKKRKSKQNPSFSITDSVGLLEKGEDLIPFNELIKLSTENINQSIECMGASTESCRPYKKNRKTNKQLVETVILDDSSIKNETEQAKKTVLKKTKKKKSLLPDVIDDGNQSLSNNIYLDINDEFNKDNSEIVNNINSKIDIEYSNLNRIETKLPKKKKKIIKHNQMNNNIENLNPSNVEQIDLGISKTVQTQDASQHFQRDFENTLLNIENINTLKNSTHKTNQLIFGTNIGKENNLFLKVTDSIKSDSNELNQDISSITEMNSQLVDDDINNAYARFKKKSFKLNISSKFQEDNVDVPPSKLKEEPVIKKAPSIKPKAKIVAQAYDPIYMQGKTKQIGTMFISSVNNDSKEFSEEPELANKLQRKEVIVVKNLLTKNIFAERRKSSLNSNDNLCPVRLSSLSFKLQNVVTDLENTREIKENRLISDTSSCKSFIGHLKDGLPPRKYASSLVESAQPYVYHPPRSMSVLGRRRSLIKKHRALSVCSDPIPEPLNINDSQTSFEDAVFGSIVSAATAANSRPPIRRRPSRPQMRYGLGIYQPPLLTKSTSKDRTVSVVHTTI